MERERLESEKTHVYWLRNRDIWNKSELRRRLGLGFGSYRGASTFASTSELWSSTSVQVSWWRRVITVLTSFWRSSESASASASERVADAQYGWAHSSSPSVRHAATVTYAEPQSASGAGAGAFSVAAIGADGHLVYSSSQQSTSVVHIERRSRIRRAAAACCCCWPLWLLPLLALALALLGGGGGLLPAETTSGTLLSSHLHIVARMSDCVFRC